MMHISQIVLQDWKLYTEAKFDFPAPTPRQNIILIGALNGYGKTSLLEAIILGVFGRDGLSLVARSSFLGVDDGKKPATSYKRFLENALHRGATAAGRNFCRVKITFADADDKGEVLEIQRTWHFRSGLYRDSDEEIHVFKGPAREPVGPGPAEDLQGLERLNWYRDYIAHALLPASLASFFLFDGEALSNFANVEMTAQVRFAIEGLLGVPVLKDMADDLLDYVKERSKGVSKGLDKTIRKVDQEMSDLQAQHDKTIERSREIEPSLNRLIAEREKLTREISGLGGVSVADMQKKMEEQGQCERAVEHDRKRLEELMERDIALALSGHNLREKLKSRLESEAILERWESGKNQGEANLDRFLAAVDSGMAEINPHLSDHQRLSVLETARSAWEQLWWPPPEGCAKAFLHSYLNDRERGKVMDWLSELNKLSAPEITECLDSIAINEAQKKRLQDDIAAIEDLGPEAGKKREHLSALHEKIQKLNQEIGALERDAKGLNSQIKDKETLRARMVSKQDEDEPSARRRRRAEKISCMVKQIIDRAFPGQIKGIAEAMTEAYHSMAHKKDLVERIAIDIDKDEDCNVQLLDKKGMNLREFDVSAGEKYIFTQALISAISRVSGLGFPMVADTPLGRLDKKHRKGLLKHLAQHKRQVILLSTNTEVVGEYLEAIAPHVQKKYLINFEHADDIGRSSVHPGYFEE